MAAGTINRALGGVNEYTWRVNNNDPSTSGIIVVLLQAAEATLDLKKHDDLAALLLAAGNTECTFTNYTRKVLTDVELDDPVTDDTNNWRQSNMPNQTWANAGGALNNSVVKFLTCYAPNTAGADSTIIPMTFHDLIHTTDGTSFTVQIDGFYRSA